MKNLILIFTLLLPFYGWTQPELFKTWPVCDLADFTSAIEKVNKNCFSNSFNADFTYFLYHDHATKLPVDQEKGYFKRFGNMYLSYNMGIYSIQNAKLKIVIDSVSKMVIIKNPDKYLEQAPGNEIISKILKASATVRFKKIDNVRYYFIDTDEKQNMASYIISIKPDDTIYELCIYYFNDPNKYTAEYGGKITPESEKIKPAMKIVFNKFIKNSGLTSADFSERRILSFDGKNYRLASKSSEFILRDLRVF